MRHIVGNAKRTQCIANRVGTVILYWCVNRLNDRRHSYRVWQRCRHRRSQYLIHMGLQGQQIIVLQ